MLAESARSTSAPECGTGRDAATSGLAGGTETGEVRVGTALLSGGFDAAVRPSAA